MTLQAVVEYCQGRLDNIARQYLFGRGVSEQSIESFGLGYCPFEVEDLVTTIGKESLLEEGVVFESEDGSICCFIRNSIVFPFINHYGKVVSVSFRPIQSNDVIKSKNLRKYWHTSFEKSLFLYGLHKSISAIRQQDCVIVVEGQFDVIMSHQFGINNTVGVGGTALSAQQIKILSRLTKKIIVVFDGDKAGQRATEKVRQKEVEDILITTARLPDGEDVDSFLQLYGYDKYLELLSSAA